MKQELYRWLYHMDLYRERFSSDDALNAAMHNIVKFYEMVHSNESHLVGPINLHELLIDPENGYFEVIANGNRDTLLQDIDSIKYMPPEVLNMKSRWSLDADRFVLAELLFSLRYCKHPYDGRMVLEHPITDVDAAKQLYSNSKFIFDPDDSVNGLDYYSDPGPVDSWNQEVNSELKNMFLKVFTQGYLDPSVRIADNEWENIL